MGATAQQVRDALNSMDYPASKQSLVDHVEQTGAEDEVVRSVRALPLADYANTDEVLRSLPLDGGTDAATAPAT